jgi:phosphoglucomutase
LLQDLQSWLDGAVVVPTRPFAGQQPGTSGLRKKVAVFAQPNYAENFVQSVFDVVRPGSRDALVIGGDGRFHNRSAIQQAIRMAVANGYSKVIVGQGGLLSTPAASNLIRKRGAAGGLLFTASHNRGGPDGDFGIKYDAANGGPAPEGLMSEVYSRTQVIDRWMTVDRPDIDLDQLGIVEVAGIPVEVIDPVADYTALMEQLFDFPLIREAVANGFTMAFDAMNGITGPYAVEILERRLGLAAGTVRNGVPREDFGGAAPDPNPVNAKDLVALMMAPDAPDLGAASDGDGDRNLIVGRGLVISPSDSLAMLAANAHHAPGYRSGLKGVARSMPTSCAVDRVARALRIPHYETPTGWKFFGNLLDSGRITMCGEESAGTGSDHVREKDGLWAVLLWLNVLCSRGLSVGDLARAHWRRFGRNYYARHDYVGIDPLVAGTLMDDLAFGLPELRRQTFGQLTVNEADEFSYADPVDGTLTAGQGIRVLFEDGSRIVFRLSGTGTEGATLRVYLECYEPPDGELGQDPAAMLAECAAAAERIAAIKHHTGRTAPDVVS